jgi:hypothetical protein
VAISPGATRFAPLRACPWLSYFAPLALGAIMFQTLALGAIIFQTLALGAIIFRAFGAWSHHVSDFGAGTIMFQILSKPVQRNSNETRFSSSLNPLSSSFNAFKSVLTSRIK